MNARHYHLVALVVLTAAQSWYYYYLPTNINGYYQAGSAFIFQFSGLMLPPPQGNLPYAIAFGFGLSVIIVYGVIALARLAGFKMGGARRRGMTAINSALYGWLISTAGIIVFVYAVAPFFGWSIIPPFLLACAGLNNILGFIGANWLGFNCLPPPPFIVTFAPQFILYWATLTGTIILLFNAARYIVYGAIHQSQKGRGG